MDLGLGYDVPWPWNVSGQAIRCPLLWSAPLKLRVLFCLDNSVLCIVTAPATQPQNKTCGVQKARWAEPRRAAHEREIRSFVGSH